MQRVAVVSRPITTGKASMLKTLPFSLPEMAVSRGFIGSRIAGSLRAGTSGGQQAMPLRFVYKSSDLSKTTNVATHKVRTRSGSDGVQLHYTPND